MDPRWLPWCWAVGAAGCAVLFWTVQPWRREWTGGARLVRKFPAAWLLPAVLLGLDAMPWNIMLGGPAGLGAWNPGGTSGWTAVGCAVVQSLQGFHFGPCAALVGALLVTVNAWGMRRGFLRGVSSVTGWRGYTVLAGLLTGAAALLAGMLPVGQGLPQVWHMAAAALAIPLVGWVSAVVLAGLLLLAETEHRSPEKVSEVRWLESAAAHSVRLWPWALGHGFVWWLGRELPDRALFYAWPLLTVAALALAFAPLLFLHVKELPAARVGGRDALMLWKMAGWQLPAWLATASLLFYVSHLAGQGLARAVEDQPAVLRIGLASLHGIVHIGVSVMSLGAWVEFRLAGATSVKRPRRPRG